MLKPSYTYYSLIIIMRNRIQTYFFAGEVSFFSTNIKSKTRIWILTSFLVLGWPPRPQGHGVLFRFGIRPLFRAPWIYKVFRLHSSNLLMFYSSYLLFFRRTEEMLFEEDIARYIILIIKNTSLILSKFQKAINGRCMKSI